VRFAVPCRCSHARPPTHATWNQKGLKAALERFNDDYSDEELAAIAARIAELSQAVPTVHAVINNNYEDQGQRNATTRARLIQAVELPNWEQRQVPGRRPLLNRPGIRGGWLV
jgi:uncharacterized protein YecE (DUF72 family)